MGRQSKTGSWCDHVVYPRSLSLIFDRDLRGISPPGFTRNQRGHQRASKLHEQLVTWYSLGLGNGERCQLVLRCRGSLWHDLQIFARRRDLVESRVDWSGGDGAAFYRRQIRYRYLPRTNCDGERVWSGGFASSPAVLGLLLCANQLFGSGVHAGLRASIWPGHSAEKTCGSRWSEKRFDLL